MDLMTFLDRYPDQDACIAHLEAVRWPSGAVCPKCGTVGEAAKLPRYGYWQCRACRAQSLASWTLAIRLLGSLRIGSVT